MDLMRSPLDRLGQELPELLELRQHLHAHHTQTHADCECILRGAGRWCHEDSPRLHAY